MRTLTVVDAAGLAAAYAGARYCVMIDGDTLPLAVGQVASDLEAYWPAERYVFITAWNPASEVHSDAANDTADALLVTRLDAAGLQRHAAWSQGAQGDWREPGWLVAGLDDCASSTLAQEFGQAGILSWDRGQPVRLQMLLHRPQGAPMAPHVDWVE
ncbi:DUF3293 domain-containing protein [Lysobacter sp. A3-1-A15]|uniref:DUF3293 domain-containing protein n=1 Tax=Novilysobacter viscosus TaxID=3098602 RepID=UPI002ED7CF02